ncbi:MAG: hypothetical protein V4490_01045, partial [Pseudomonadota bacterium]
LLAEKIKGGCVHVLQKGDMKHPKTKTMSDFFGHIEKIEIACDEQIKRLGVIANTTLNKYQSEVNSKRKTSETFEKDYYVEQLIFQLNWMISRLQVLPAAVPKPTNRKTLPMREPTLWLSQNMTEHDFDSLRSALYRFVTVDLPKLLTKSAKETPEGPEWYFVSQSQMMQEFSSVRRKQLRMANDLYNSTINTYVYQLKALQHKLVICDTPALSTSIPNFSKVYMAMHGDMERIEHILEKLSKNGIQKELLELIQAQNNSLNPLWTTGLTKAASKHANPAALPTSFFQTITQQHIIQVGIPKKPVLLSVSKQTKRPRAIHVNRSAIGTEITLPNVCETLRAGKLGTSSAFRPTVK